MLKLAREAPTIQSMEIDQLYKVKESCFAINGKTPLTVNIHLKHNITGVITWLMLEGMVSTFEVSDYCAALSAELSLGITELVKRTQQ